MGSAKESMYSLCASDQNTAARERQCNQETRCPRPACERHDDSRLEHHVPAGRLHCSLVELEMISLYCVRHDYSVNSFIDFAVSHILGVWRDSDFRSSQEAQNTLTLSVTFDLAAPVFIDPQAYILKTHMQ